VARSVGDFGVLAVRRRSSRRGVAWLAAVDLAVLASGVGYLVGQAGGADKDAAILAGRRSGQLAGQRAGSEYGYAAGRRAGRRAGVRLTYQRAYQTAVREGRKP
jgi:hypothetical protein